MKKQRGDQKPDHCCFHWWQKCSIKPTLSHFTLTHHLKRKAVWNSTHEQIKADMKWHTQTLLGKKKKKNNQKRRTFLKKGSTTHCTSYINFSGWPWCDATTKLMFSKSMFCLFLWQLVQVFLWLKIRLSSTFFFLIFHLYLIGVIKKCHLLNVATRYSNFPMYPPSNPYNNNCIQGLKLTF